MAKKRRSTRKSTSKKVPTQSNSQNVCVYCCPNHRGWGLVIFLIGIIFLLKDYGGAIWWRVSWYTILFLIIGLWMLSNKK